MTDSLVPFGSAVNRKRFAEAGVVLPFGSMVTAKVPKEPNEFGRRVLTAMKEEQYRSQNDLERKAGLGKGYLSRLIYGERGGTSFNAAHMAALARELHVTFEWLVLGTGPMRKGGRETTPAEQAITTARMLGCREDAIATAWSRNADREAEMTVSDWTDVINTEASRLERAGVPRPEVTADKKDAIQRTKKQLERAKQQVADEAAEERPVVAPTRPRATGTR